MIFKERKNDFGQKARIEFYKRQYRNMDQKNGQKYQSCSKTDTQKDVGKDG